jgi:hypothetical protein
MIQRPSGSLEYREQLRLVSDAWQVVGQKARRQSFTSLGGLMFVLQLIEFAAEQGEI